MRNIAKITILIAGLIPAASAMAADTCDFDQEAVLRELISTAKTNPGGVLDRKNHLVTWTGSSGKSVQIAYSGCVDLGSSVGVSFPESTNIRTAVAELIRATSKYWSPIHANEMARILTAKQFTTNLPVPGVVEFEVSGGASRAFPFGFTLTVQPDEASLSWQQL